ncbi:MAG: 50S ribosomal protein L18 [Betaproteobacteria bacterium]|nr:50S ribosomal protein L18 [Betaproteobacteria bacterium]
MREGKLQARRRRAARGRALIALGGRNRLVAYRSGRHIYVQLLAPNHQVLASASSVEKSMRGKFRCGGNRKAAEAVGQLLTEKIKSAGLPMQAAFDRSGYAYHGRVQALADALRAGGMEF